LAQAYAEAHAVLAPSRYESFGLVYQEALAYGRPVVACAEDASARAFVGAPGAGPLAREATGAALAEALRPLLTDPALRAAYRGRALAASGRFTRAVLARETLALYDRAIAAARGRPGGRASVPQSP
jgi:glycosyltransferase involved in cell wall biosynthesis